MRGLLSAQPLRKQAGMVLLVSLVFMLIITIIGSEAMLSATLQERMAGNTKESSLAFQAAEASLREAEQVLAGVNVGPFNGTLGMYQSCPDAADERDACDSPDWQDYDSTGWVSVANFDSKAAKQPEYIIERMTSSQVGVEVLDSDRVVPTAGFYRVLARGYGASNRSMVVLSTTYRRED
ncbi:hypothetical protein IB286_12760 [Spongiibacter sp. KMU-158]|uniref:Type IV pilus assembly protein PilX n=1 Tax=Spongiibacter pelagi TaxID=2760804 RepID=A0A927C239_9GAMM|nr:PilX N-terminal domain-containing pilus assembly protein [Spongiibacter pelagi]MBD2859874.1 hypothetical protein [Spongiibacter pelagi]